jgi:hypothetical protein
MSNLDFYESYSLASVNQTSLKIAHLKIRDSHGRTTGTNATIDLLVFKAFVIKLVEHVVVLLGKMHKLEVGAKRFVDGQGRVKNDKSLSKTFSKPNYREINR